MLLLGRLVPFAVDALWRACPYAEILEFFACCLNSELVYDEVLDFSIKRLVVDMTVRDVVHNVSHGVACGRRKEEERATRTANFNRKQVSKRSANRQFL